MTIEKGEAWGAPWVDDPTVPAPVELAGDAELSTFLLDRWTHLPADRWGDPAIDDDPVPEVTLRSGDLLRTLGLDRPRTGADRYRYPLDVAVARLGRGDTTVELPFVAHLTVRNRPLSGLGPGLSVAVMNAAWLGDLRLGPRAHPNDGLLDITEGTVGLAQRREATRRARSGSHLPHPGLQVRRRADWERTWDRPVVLWLDGVRRGRVDRVAVSVRPDAVALVA